MRFITIILAAIINSSLGTAAGTTSSFDFWDFTFPTANSGSKATQAADSDNDNKNNDDGSFWKSFESVASRDTTHDKTSSKKTLDFNFLHDSSTTTDGLKETDAVSDFLDKYNTKSSDDDDDDDDDSTSSKSVAENSDSGLLAYLTSAYDSSETDDDMESESSTTSDADAKSTENDSESNSEGAGDFFSNIQTLIGGGGSGSGSSGSNNTNHNLKSSGDSQQTTSADFSDLTSLKSPDDDSSEDAANQLYGSVLGSLAVIFLSLI